MRLLCSKLLLVVVATTIACGDSTAPMTTPGVFVLRSVNGQSVPAVLPSPIPEQSTVVSGTIALQADGSVVLIERRLAFGIPGEQTSTRFLRYRLDGHRITIEPTDCPPNALCVETTGVLINSMLSLDFGPFMPNGVIYLYHRAEDSELISPHAL